MRLLSKRILLILMTIIYLFCFDQYHTFGQGNPDEMTNADIPSTWARQEVEKAAEYNLVTPNILGKYKEKITREEFCELAVNLYKAMNDNPQIQVQEDPFQDTDNISVLEAYKLGIVCGKAPGLFKPSEFLTREETSVMFYRILQITETKSDLHADNNSSFIDFHVIAPWAKEAVILLNSEGIIQGVGANKFDPNGHLTREAAIALIKRMYEKYKLNLNEKLSKLNKILQQQLGKPYRYGSAGPNSFDCSGLVYYVYGKLGFSLPRTADAQSKVGTYVSKEELRYGDLVFFARDGINVNHAGIYIGSGNFIHAPQTGEVVKATTLETGYYARTFKNGRRLIE